VKLFITSKTGTRICAWHSYALLRDNVQHYLERGEPDGRFPALHGIECAVDNGQHLIDASRLRGEVLRAWSALWKMKLERAAISLRTRALLTGNSHLPAIRGTVAAQQAGWELPVQGSDETPIPRAAQEFIRTVLLLTDTAVDGDMLEVRCATPSSRVAESRATARPISENRSP
jgi:hypothetical protein